MIAGPRPRRLLILACSATKRYDPAPIPARDRYDGRPLGGRCALPTHAVGLLASASSLRGSVSGTHGRPSTTMTHGSARTSAAQ
jgi:hypothetical protein